MSYERAEGLVFKTKDVLEADKHFFLFTKEFGRIEVVGRGIRKIDAKLRSGIELFSLSSIEFVQGKHTKTLTDAVMVKRFSRISQVPEKLIIAYGIGSLIEHFIRGEARELAIWDVLLFVFEKLDHSTTAHHRQICYYYFFWKMVAILGHRPEVQKCVSCGGLLDPRALFFSYREGGLECLRHEKKHTGHRITEGAVKMLRCILQDDWSTLEKVTIDSVDRKSFTMISSGYYHYLISMYSFQK